MAKDIVLSEVRIKGEITGYSAPASGHIYFSLKEKGKDELTCEVMNSGPIATRKGVNLPGVVLTMPFVSEQDEKDVRFGARNGVDFIAASFVRRASDVKEIKRILDDEGRPDLGLLHLLAH